MARYGSKKGSNLLWTAVNSVNVGGSWEEGSPRLESNLNWPYRCELFSLSHLRATELGFIANLILSFAFFFLWDNILLCSSGCPHTHDPPALDSCLLVLPASTQVCVFCVLHTALKLQSSGPGTHQDSFLPLSCVPSPRFKEIWRWMACSSQSL